MTGYGDKKDTEENEQVRGNFTTIHDGEWKLNVHTYKVPRLGFGMRRYHRHGDDWYTVKHTDATLGGPTLGRWVCNLCGEAPPDTMEGYINLSRWAAHADKV